MLLPRAAWAGPSHAPGEQGSCSHPGKPPQVLIELVSKILACFQQGFGCSQLPAADSLPPPHQAEQPLGQEMPPAHVGLRQAVGQQQDPL